MIILVTIVHVLACIVLVLTVLLQAGKGADIGAVFGGASTTIFGSSGAGNFLTRLTTGAAIIFMLTSLTLTYGSMRSTSHTLMPERAAAKGAAQPGAGGEDVAPGGDEGGGDEAAAPEGAAPAGEAAAPAEQAPAVPAAP
jgi:preprotein translocase subunit SecG